MIEFEEEYPIEPVPRIKLLRCRVLVYSIYLLIITSPVITSFFAYWWEKSLWIAFLFGLFTLLATGVVLSKMRVSAIPFKQREINYTTMEVVRWYVGKNICI